MISRTRKNYYITRRQGFALVEVLIAAGILMGALVLLGLFQADVFKQNTFLGKSLEAESEARSALKKAIGSLRTMSASNTGDYPILVANKNNLTFFSDTDGDGVREMIRYFWDGKDLKRGTTVPTGQPYIYSTSTEKITIEVHNIVNASTTGIFAYYDENYAGTTTPLSLPANIPDIRLIQMTVQVEADPNRAPVPMTFTSGVSPRNLKDNL